MNPVVAAAAIAALTSILTTVLTVRQNKKLNETHEQVTVNSYKSKTPTLLDLVHMLVVRTDEIESRLDRIEERSNG